MTIAKVQHYVPQFLLRNFGNGKKDQVWVYDKSANRSFPSNTKNVASESRFYDFEIDGEYHSLEPWLGELETEAKKVISSILDADSLAHLSNEERLLLASFLAVQLTRTKTFREEWNAFPTMLREHFEKTGDQVAPGSQAEQLLQDHSENGTKEQTARIIIDAPETYARHFLDKDWVLAATHRKHPFLLSDNPLTRQNFVDRPHRGNLGLKVPGIEIYFPLSPSRALAMWCPTLTDLVHRGAAALVRNGGPSALASAADPNGVLSISKALLSGGIVQYTPENVTNFNSLQVVWSERYIFSTMNNFELAKEMLDAQPHHKRGPRSTVA